MAAHRLRQARLSGSDPELELAERWANWRVLRRSYLSATALASYAVCPVKPFVERAMGSVGLELRTMPMMVGAQRHEELQEALTARLPPSHLTLKEALARRELWLAAEVPLRDERRRLRGIADVVYAEQGILHVLELKHTQPPRDVDPTWQAAVWYPHGLQLHFYGLLARVQLGHAPQLALTYLKGSSGSTLLERLTHGAESLEAIQDLEAASVALPTRPETRTHVNDLVRSFRRDERRPTLPEARHGDAGRCRTCPVRAWCPRRLDAPGTLERLPRPRGAS